VRQELAALTSRLDGAITGLATLKSEQDAAREALEQDTQTWVHDARGAADAGMQLAEARLTASLEQLKRTANDRYTDINDALRAERDLAERELGVALRQLEELGSTSRAEFVNVRSELQVGMRGLDDQHKEAMDRARTEHARQLEEAQARSQRALQEAVARTEAKQAELVQLESKRRVELQQIADYDNELLAMGAKRCPTCHLPGVKSGKKCNTVTCAQCQTVWCYECGLPKSAKAICSEKTGNEIFSRLKDPAIGYRPPTADGKAKRRTLRKGGQTSWRLKLGWK
jgi:hypothetical protein